MAEFLDSPWCRGRRIEVYYGPLFARVLIDQTEHVGHGIVEALDILEKAAEARGANAVVCPTLEIDPFGERILICAGGSAFELSAPLQPAGTLYNDTSVARESP